MGVYYECVHMFPSFSEGCVIDTAAAHGLCSAILNIDSYLLLEITQSAPHHTCNTLREFFRVNICATKYHVGS